MSVLGVPAAEYVSRRPNLLRVLAPGSPVAKKLLLRTAFNIHPIKLRLTTLYAGPKCTIPNMQLFAPSRTGQQVPRGLAASQRSVLEARRARRAARLVSQAGAGESAEAKPDPFATKEVRGGPDRAQDCGFAAGAGGRAGGGLQALCAV